MKLPYFFEPLISKDDHVLSAETSKHCIQVLRMNEGDLLNLTDGKGNLYTARIIHADKKHCEVDIQESKTLYPTKKISIAISLLKNPTRLEWFIEKATEIGVSEIIPLLCDHTEKENFRYDRMNSILISAMLQSKQTWLPALHQPKKFTDIITENFNGTKLIAHCAYDEKLFLNDIKPVQPVLILIGPEGDFSQHEIETALEKNFTSASLGNTRLRTETAGIAAAVMLCNR